MYKRRLFYILTFLTMLAMLFASNVSSSTALSVEGKSQNQTTYEKLNLIMLVKASKRSNDLINKFEGNNAKTQLQIVQGSVTQAFNSQTYSNLNIGIMAYGHLKHVDYDISCSAENVEELLPIQTFSQTANLDRFNSISGQGNSPTAIALDEAAKKLSQSNNGNALNALLLIADGEDDCLRDPTKYQSAETVAQRLGQEQHIVIYVIGLNVNDRISEQLQAIALQTNGKYYRTDNNLNATDAKTTELRKKIIEFLDELVSQVSGSVVIPTSTTSVPETTTSPASPETETTSTSEPPITTDLPVPTSTPVIVESPSQTWALSGILIVAVIGLFVILIFGYVYWNSKIKGVNTQEKKGTTKDKLLVANDHRVEPSTSNATKGENVNIPTKTFNSLDMANDTDKKIKEFLSDVFQAYSSVGGGRYIPLESLKQNLSSKYSMNEFNDLLTSARQRFPSKVWIDKDAQGQIIVKIFQ